MEGLGVTGVRRAGFCAPGVLMEAVENSWLRTGVDGPLPNSWGVLVLEPNRPPETATLFKTTHF